MKSVASELARLLSTVRVPGDFYVAGTTDLSLPLLTVDGVGPIALPLLTVQAEQLIAVADRAPYGRGADTLVDTAVRRTWQIGADRVHIEGRTWAATLQSIVTRAAEGLGVTAPVAAKLYKLLVYDEGSFFVGHRDTEKVAGMFATLVVALPSIHAGGDLVVRHKGREVRLDLAGPDPSVAAFAAFYADCVHEVLPITSGCRLVLVYNLLRKGRGRLPEPPNYEAETARIAALLSNWATGKGRQAEAAPEKLVYPLEHAYTPAELSFQSLKGSDAAAAAVLVAAAGQAGCELHVALLTIEESGIAEYTGDSYRSWRGRSDDDFEAVEVCDRSAVLSDWRCPDGSPAEFGVFPFEDTELCPPAAFEDLTPDDECFQEATGNEGASFERSYRRAALVLWPRQRRLAVVSEAGLSVSLPWLAGLARRWQESGEGHTSALWKEAHQLSGHVLRAWPSKAGWSPHAEPSSDAAGMLVTLTQLGDTTRIDAFLANVCAAGTYGKSDNEAICRAATLLTPQRSAELFERIVAANASTDSGACSDLLARGAVTRPAGGAAHDLVGTAKALVELLPGDPARAPPPAVSWRSQRIDADMVVDVVTALDRIDAALAERAAEYVLAWPKTYGLDAVVLPAVRQLSAHTTTRDLASARRLRQACIDHLRLRTSEPLEPPSDWSRAARLGCRCAHCADLARFLGNPEQKVWTLKAAQAARSHVDATVKRSHCDVDMTTERQGRPYTLVCTKNQASYDRRVRQRKKDLADLARLA